MSTLEPITKLPSEDIEEIVNKKVLEITKKYDELKKEQEQLRQSQTQSSLNTVMGQVKEKAEEKKIEEKKNEDLDCPTCKSSGHTHKLERDKKDKKDSLFTTFKCTGADCNHKHLLSELPTSEDWRNPEKANLYQCETCGQGVFRRTGGKDKIEDESCPFCATFDANAAKDSVFIPVDLQSIAKRLNR